jgi:uncharacterized protein involved in tolerance to divalent cations
MTGLPGTFPMRAPIAVTGESGGRRPVEERRAARDNVTSGVSSVYPWGGRAKGDAEAPRGTE